MAISDPPVNVTKIRSGVAASVSGAIANMAADSLMVAVTSVFGNGNGGTHQASDSENGAYSTITHKEMGTASICGHFFQNTVAGSGSSGNCSGGSSAQAITGIFYEFSGISTTAAFTIGDAGGSTGTGTAPATGNFTNSTATALAIAAMTNQSGANPTLMTINGTGTVGTYSENTSSGKETNGASFQTLSAVWQVLASSQTNAHVWTSSNVGWAAIGFAFNGVAAGGGGGVTTISPVRALMGVGR